MKRYIYIAALLLTSLSLHAQELLNYPLDTINNEVVYRYQVEKSVGLYRIGLNFNVTQSEIVRLNPQLRERGLHFGETLLIPTGIILENPSVQPTTGVEPVAVPTMPETVSQADTTAKAETDLLPADSIVSGADGTDSLALNRRVIELALMLPFESQQTKRSQNAERMMEFYQGALLALRDLQNDSVLFRLRVYDTERSERRVAALCTSHELDSVRGIIGLAYPIQIAYMSQWCNVRQIPLVLPFSDDTDLSGNIQLMQFNSTDIQEADSLCEWLVQRDSIHCVTVEVRESDMTASMRTLRKQMRAHELHYTSLPMRDLLTDSAAYAMDSAQENIIILHSDRYQHVRMLIPHLVKLQQDGFRVRLLSQYSWQKEQIELPQVYTSVFTAESDITAYETQWNTYFSREHVSDVPRYDLLGYDLMRMLIGRLQGETVYHGLQSNIEWLQTGENGGWQNGIVNVVEK